MSQTLQELETELAGIKSQIAKSTQKILHGGLNSILFDIEYLWYENLVDARTKLEAEILNLSQTK